MAGGFGSWVKARLSRLTRRTERKGVISDGDPSPLKDIILSAVGGETTPGFFFDVDGKPRNLYTHLAAIIAALTDISTDSSETETTPTTHNSATVHTVAHHYSGVYFMVVTGGAGYGTMTGTLRVSNDGTNWDTGSTAPIVVNADNVYQGVIDGDDMAFKYHNWSWSKVGVSAWSNVITMSYNGAK